ncbi:hypothetical protein CONCODRAFT_6729 [Conidiobolus coronatus NRRL 28638]|uniref:F-box domain-containing protein n=1 Tax=Conidiobolus coronatus (strain ATCC 28846 / CBS 209.66 / NRRL 28638) TaxID=796925 RepID=A0A137P6M0_CONC2|nr:hypothetical protein CONCODRAFT_6729 [Conidiobolus coronatus NRRL 28638]|eukprot:KXN70652.1 hypothetical protein CONCODRAFT_6729 [Conidiobolus coronatus NRRL 28638]
MSDNKWELIFINEEFKIYLNSEEFAELSKLSKVMRLKLKSKVFEKISFVNAFNDFTCHELQKLNGITDLSINNQHDFSADDYISHLNRCLQQFVPYTKNASFKPYSNHYQLLEASNVLRQLTKISISGIVVSLTAFKKTLFNLKSLKNLSIESSKFIKYKCDPNLTATVKLPATLEAINWQCCKFYICGLEEDPQILNYNYDNVLSPNSDLLFEFDHFPKLRELSTFLAPVLFNTEFLAIHPEIIALNLIIEKLNESTVPIFGKIQNIKKLGLNVESMSFALNMDSTQLNFQELTHLKFELVNLNNWSILEKLVKLSPNLIDLRVTFNRHVYHFLVELINNTPSLQKLVIKAERNRKYNIDYLAVCPCLKLLDIYFDADVVPTMLKLSQFPSLKTINFSKKFYDESYLSTLNHKTVPEPWRVIEMEDFIRYCR